MGLVSTGLESQFDVRKKLMQLGKKYRKIDRNMKKGLIQMEKNFLYYLNEGSQLDDLVFYLSHHMNETNSLMSQWSTADPKFNKVLRGRKIVLNEIASLFEEVNQ